MGQRQRYLVYLIHLWPAEEGDKPAWRASLESARSGEKHAFGCLEDLFAYLREQVSSQAPDQASETPPNGES
jgi:hypothetical protein